MSVSVTVTAIGGDKIARQLEAGPGAIRSAVREVLAEAGDEIVQRSRALAPRKSGVMAERILWYFGLEATAKQRRKMGINRFGGLDFDRGPVLFTARPTGTVAHLIERGVNTTRKRHTRRVASRSRSGVLYGKTFKTRTRVKFGTTAQGIAFVKAHPFKIAAHPFFMPAVDSVAPSLPARLQNAMSVAGKAMQGAA